MKDKIRYAFYVYVAIVLHNAISFMVMGLVGSSFYDTNHFIKSICTFIAPETLVLTFVPFSGLFLATIWFFAGIVAGSYGLFYYYLFNLVWVYFADYIFTRIKDNMSGVKVVNFWAGFFDYSKKLFFQLIGFFLVSGVLSLAYETFSLKQRPNAFWILTLLVLAILWAVLSYFKYKK